MWSQREGYDRSDSAAVAGDHTMHAHCKHVHAQKPHCLSNGTNEAGISAVTMRFQMFSNFKVLLTG